MAQNCLKFECFNFNYLLFEQKIIFKHLICFIHLEPKKFSPFFLGAFYQFRQMKPFFISAKKV